MSTSVPHLSTWCSVVNLSPLDWLQPNNRRTTMEHLFEQYRRYRQYSENRTMSDQGFEHFSGTMPIAARQQFDVNALEAWCKSNIDGFAGAHRHAIQRRQSNPTFKLTTPNRTYVMRAKPGPAAKLLPSAHAIDREYRVMAPWHAGIPVPKVLA